MLNQTHPNQVKRKQQRNLLILVIIVLIIGIGLYYSLDNNTQEQKPKDKIDKIDVATPLSHVDAQSVWIERAQNQLAQENKSQGALQQQLQFLQQSKNVEDKTTQQQAQQIQQLQVQLSNLQRQFTQQKSSTSGQPNSGTLFPSASGNNSDSGDGFISDISLHLSPRPTTYDLIPAKNPNTFIPAGTFVRAITIGGADASAGVTSQGDPTPMLYRILDQGTLPNHQHSHLKDCVATAAAIGDISSERGEVRLERLSCTKPNGQIVEIPVEATVFGPDGKNGVRGNALWRENALLERAFVAGTLSGISNGIAQSYTSNSISPIGAVTTVDNGKILQYGLANGVGNAADKLADYNIKRAEQYHPVIQLSAGTVVDIVFLKGFYFDGKQHSNHDPDQLVASSFSDTQNTITNGNNSGNTLSPLPLTPQQIQMLKQKNAQQGYNS